MRITLELAPFHREGCRNIIGPVPPLLWMICNYSYHTCFNVIRQDIENMSQSFLEPFFISFIYEGRRFLCRLNTTHAILPSVMTKVLKRR